MKIEQFRRCLLWTILYSVLYLVGASDDELVDFDFSDLKEIDWNYETDNSKEVLPHSTTEENIITFEDDNDLLEENQVHPFDWREKVLRTALSKALSNKAVRQKFVEVMPILRVLSKQQRLALSALITAQINAKKGNELKLDQVRMMFGDDKSLILPIVYDIANLVRSSAKKYIEFDYNLADFGDFSKPKISFERRNLQLTPEEMAAEDDNKGIGTLPATAQMTQKVGIDGLEDFMSDEVLDPKEINEELQQMKSSSNNNSANLDDVSLQDEDDLTDPLSINHELQKGAPTFQLLKLNKSQEREMLTLFATTTKKPSSSSSPTPTKLVKPRRRIRRSARRPKQLIHKLVRSVPLVTNEDDLQKGRVGSTLKLNTTAFALPKDTNDRDKSSSSQHWASTTPKAALTVTSENYEPYMLVEDMAFASLNGSDIYLNDREGEIQENESNGESNDEVLPTPEELISGHRYRVAGNKLMPIRSMVMPEKRKRVQVRSRQKQGSVAYGGAAPKKCERFTASMCIKTDDYPM